MSRMMGSNLQNGKIQSCSAEHDILCAARSSLLDTYLEDTTPCTIIVDPKF